MTNIEYYELAISPHIGWLLGQIENSKDGYIILKISDVAKAMGEVFCEKSESSIYMTLRHILFKKNIFVESRKHKDGSQMLMLRMADSDDYIENILDAKINKEYVVDGDEQNDA